ncbi:MAG: hypothetical protein ABI822_14750 [Bryobacteraceae bacterium]
MSEQKSLQLLASYREDLNLYAKDCLTIRDKKGQIERFPGFNSAQLYTHKQLEAQMQRTGKVRALVLKGRQQGISMYTAVRFYRRATLHRGTNVYILSHEQASADALFKMVDRFQTNNPIAPHVGVSNVKELVFDRLDSSYAVATAGAKAGGRSRTLSLFHGSECAYWENAGDHFSASVQAVPDMQGTEIILESTAAGASGEFYERWQDAVAERGDYIPVFVPWFWQEEYIRAPDPYFELATEPGDTGMSEKEYAELFNLPNERMAWRRAKVAELRSVQRFDQEYPGSPDMAFQSADTKKSFILPIQILRARKRKNIIETGPLIIGVDPSGPGKDRFSVAWRRGFKITRIDYRQMPQTLEAVHWLRSIIDDDQPQRMFVDLGNIGHAIVSLLKAVPDLTPDGRRYSEVVRGINFGATSQAKMARPKVPGPKNRRAEMWDRSREWLDLEEGVSIPDMDMLQADATAPRIKPLLNNDFLIESKDEMRTRHVRSPDLWDSVALTFAEIERIVDTAKSGTQGQGRKSSDGKRIAKNASSAAYKSTLPGGSDSWMGV